MSRLRIPYRKLFKFIVLFYTVVLVTLLLLWTSYGKVPIQGLFFEGRKPTHGVREHKLESISPSQVRKEKRGILRMAQEQGQKGCGVKTPVTFMKKTVILNQDPVCGWLEGFTSESQGSFINYGRMFARLSNVVIDPSLAGGRKGGEAIKDVLNQKEEDEYFKLKKGYFKLKCETPPITGFNPKDHLNDWNTEVVCGEQAKTESRIKGMTLAVKRYEYVNLYHTMTDYYNAFLMMLVFNQNPDNITVLWVDAHPQGGLDDTWNVLFGETVRAGHLKVPTTFDDMVWSVMGYNSPLNEHYRPFVPYLDEFREFFLSRYSVPTQKVLNCDKLNILFIWRRDYVAHPRNPKGLVKRKIANEDELIANVHNILPTHNITAVQLDVLPMKKQLELIANTDILLGMHGAGLSHTLFLPDHAGLIEFYPTYWTQANRHFRAMASWRGLSYQTWQNHDVNNEKADFFTYIPVQTVNQMLLEVKGKVCSSGAS